MGAPAASVLPGADDQHGSGAPSPSLGVARAAGINALGNVASRALGLVREAVIAGTFGASGATSAFDAVSGVPKMVYELLVGGMLSAALVPVLSEYAAAEKRAELARVLSTLLTLGAVVLVAVTILLEATAPWIAAALVGGFDANLVRTATLLVRLIVPAIPIYGLSGILQAYHYARKRFVYPAMGAPAHNLGVIVAVAILAGRLDIASLSVGILVAATTQLLVQLPGLRGMRLSLCLDWRHPVVRRILALYAPVVLSIVVQNVGIVIDRNLASRTVNEAITWMTKATFLVQLPLGLVSMAISLAVLPSLSQIDADRDPARFKRMLSLGLRLVLVIIIPAAAGLYALGTPIIALIFEHGAFSPVDTVRTWHALRLYLLGLPFTAIDLPLVFAFYAQKNTVMPVAVGIVTVLLYLVVGPTLAFALGLGYLGLVLANAVQLTAHAMIMLLVFARRFGGLEGYGVVRAALKASVASAPLAALAYVSSLWLSPRLPPGTVGEALLVAICAGLGIGGYLLGAHLLRIEEVSMLWGLAARRLGVKGTDGRRET